MALFEILAIGGGALVGHQADRITFLLQGGPLFRKGELVRVATPNRTIKMAAGATAGLGLATKSVLLTAGGAAGVVFGDFVGQTLGVSKAFAQAAPPELPPKLSAATIKRGDAARIAANSLLRNRPSAEPAILNNPNFRVAVAKSPPRSPPTPLTTAAAKVFQDRGLVLEGELPLTRAQKLGAAALNTERRKAPVLKRKRRMRSKRKRRKTGPGLVMDRPLTQVTASQPLGFGQRIDIGRPLAFG